jgi:O-methyltransferase involved in polyketide biosynthesis
MNLTNRNYKTISPSAKSLLLTKAITKIPFARQAAELMMYPEKFNPDIINKDIGFWTRVVHFENRYWSIDQLLKGLPIKNILELSSGFSFRGLEAIKQNKIHYIDTDLPDVITAKKDFISALQPDSSKAEGKLEILPLNALDEKNFDEIITRFPAGEIVIINEGFLMYLDADEKEKLCRIIYKTLKQRGGYWITADIYIKSQIKDHNLKIEHDKHFFEEHNIEDNKFDSFEAAKSFFNKAGFLIDKEAEPARSNLSSLKYLLASEKSDELLKRSEANKIRATWRLKIKTFRYEYTI